METYNYTDTKEYALNEQIIKERKEHEKQEEKSGQWIFWLVGIIVLLIIIGSR